jgi:hypothetical protein
MTIFTTISKNYVSDWGVQEGVREIMQNAMDSDQKGNRMGVSYNREARQLLIYNQNTNLSRETLLLGSTTKVNDPNQIGQFGEGYKIGSLALIRQGKPVVIHNNKERWECVIKKNEEFESDVLAFKISKSKDEWSSKLMFEINNIEPDEWRNMRNLFLSIYSPDPKTLLRTPTGAVILDKNLKGNIYCGGIFISHEKDLAYGYNFKPSILSLNRDRNMVNGFDLKWNTSKIWGYLSANKKGKLFDVKKMLQENIPDVEFIKEFSDYTVKGKIAEEFFKDNGITAYPVTTNEEATRVRNMGYSPIYSSSSYYGVLSSSLGSLDELERKIELDYTIFHNITAIDDANLAWVFEVMFKVDPKFKFTIEVVQFKIGATRSLTDVKDNKLTLNCNLLKSKYDILHEAIKHYCGMNVKRKETMIWKRVYQQSIEGINET